MWGQDNADDALLLAETLATRLCHDLSGQLNALVGAVEMMREDPQLTDEAASLAQDAGEAMVRRLRLVRAAWGSGCTAMSVDELCGLLSGVFGRHLRLDLAGLAKAGAFSPSAARLTLNVLLLAAESLPAGGVVAVAGDPEQDLVVRIDGPRAAWPPGLAGMLADPADARTCLRDCDGIAAARVLQAPLTALIAHAAGLRLTLLLGPATEAAPPLLVALNKPH